MRLPFLDLRLLAYLLALPPIPWCVRKQLLRVTMKDTLPEEICRRPKSPLGRNLLDLHLSQGLQLPFNFSDVSIDAFVNLEALMQLDINTQRPRWSSEIGLRAISLGYWLDNVRK